jgi:hypothetical protein
VVSVSAKPVLAPLELNVPAIARRPESEVSRFLGMPDPGTTSAIGNSSRRTYQGGKVEVVYVDGQARWIKLRTSKELPFSRQALRKLGLPVCRPTYDNSPHVLSWHNIARLKEVSLYGGGPQGSASWVLVCVETSENGAGKARSSRLSLPGLRALLQA